MKRILNTLPLILLIIYLQGCDKPAPTEFIGNDDQQSNDLIIESFGSSLEDEFYSNGFDTTGIDPSLRQFTNLISVSGIKYTYKGQTRNSSLAQAVFLNRNKPVFNQEGRIIGFESVTPGVVSFNNVDSKIVPYRVRYRSQGMLKDTLLGFRYQLFSGWFNLQDPFGYNYSSQVNFRFTPLTGLPSEFNIITPAQLNAEVQMSGSLTNKNLRAKLTWNQAGNQKIELIIGVVPRNSDDTFPLFRIHLRDRGTLNIPPALLNEFPPGRFSHIVFSLRRKYEANRTENNTELHVLSQSIHTIKADIP